MTEFSGFLQRSNDRLEFEMTKNDVMNKIVELYHNDDIAEWVLREIKIAELKAEIKGMNSVIHSSFVQSNLDKVEELKKELATLEVKKK